MEQLIPIINKLQDVFNTVGADILHLPQIAVVGSQSSGKSSVLENIVGKDFLPRGHGIVTRRPLVLQLVHVEETQQDRDYNEWGEFLHAPNKIFTDFAEIRKEIEAETDRVTGSNKGISNKPINLKIYSPHVLNLTLVDLPGITKVPVGDQPEDIEKQIRTLVRSYICNPNCIILAVTPANVDLANSDALKLAKSIDPEGNRTIGVCTKIDLMDAGTDAFDVLSGRVVPVKLGFIGVVNRSQADINNNKPIAESLKAEEQFFASHPAYQSIAHRCGTGYLAKNLNRLLMHHIRDCLPELKSRITSLMTQTQQTYNAYGEPLLDKFNKGSLLLQIITKFSSSYCGAIEGTARDIQTTELSGGARICYIFHETFGKTLENVNPLEGLTLGDIRTAIRNATGPRPALFVPEISFELLVKRQIRRLEEPALRCVELVFDELLRIIQQCETQELARFQALRDQLSDTVSSLLRNRLPIANAMIENLVAIELAYINTNHPDFTTGSQAVSTVMDQNIRKVNSNSSKDHHHLSTSNTQLSVESSFSQGRKGSFNDINGAEFGAEQGRNPTVLTSTGRLSPTAGNQAAIGTGLINNASGLSTQQLLQNAQNQLQQSGSTAAAAAAAQQGGGLFGLFFRPAKPNTKEDGVALDISEAASDVAARSQPTPKLNTPHSNNSSSSEYKLNNSSLSSSFTSSSSSSPSFTHSSGSYSNGFSSHPISTVYGDSDLMLDHLPQHLRDDRRDLTTREQIETDLIKNLIVNYFKIVRKNIQDTVPKAIMHFLVNWIKENIQSELVSHLYREDLFESLLEESPHVASKRKQTAEMLQALKRANKVLAEIRADANGIAAI